MEAAAPTSFSPSVLALPSPQSAPRSSPATDSESPNISVQSSSPTSGVDPASFSARRYRIRARWIRFDTPGAPSTALLGGVPRHGLGTQNVPEREALGAYASVALLVLGFYCYVPWLLCLLFARHPSPVARASAALSLLATLVLVVVLLACTWHPLALECAATVLSWSA